LLNTWEALGAMSHVHVTVLSLILLAGCGRQDNQPKLGPTPGIRQPNQDISLTEARRGFQTKLIRRESASEPVPEPPPRLFRTVRYDSSVGKLAAYLSPAPQDGKKHAAIIWITGGDCNSIDNVWQGNASE
jgi:hypothetical protein